MWHVYGWCGYHKLNNDITPLSRFFDTKIVLYMVTFDMIYGRHIVWVTKWVKQLKTDIGLLARAPFKWPLNSALLYSAVYHSWIRSNFICTPLITKQSVTEHLMPLPRLNLSETSNLEKHTQPFTSWKRTRQSKHIVYRHYRRLNNKCFWTTIVQSLSLKKVLSRRVNQVARLQRYNKHCSV